MDTLATDKISKRTSVSDADTVIEKVTQEDNTISMRFNVMPERMVEETLFISEYRIGHRYIEASFDRSYKSSMLRSPDHLVATTVQCHTQKMLYAYICHELKIPYDPSGPELVKIWCTWFEMKMPSLVRKNTDVIQRVRITGLTPREKGGYDLSFESVIEEDLVINGRVVAYTL